MGGGMVPPDLFQAVLFQVLAGAAVDRPGVKDTVCPSQWAQTSGVRIDQGMSA